MQASNNIVQEKGLNILVTLGCHGFMSGLCRDSLGGIHPWQGKRKESCCWRARDRGS